MVDSTPRHVLVLFENSSRGAAALREAAELAAREKARLTIVAVAVIESEQTRCCDTRAVYWNGVVRELAAADLDRARASVAAGTAAEFKVVSERSVPVALALEAHQSRADTIIVPRDRGVDAWSRSRLARRVRRRATDSVVLAADGGRRGGPGARA